jgi:hypothetical protein
MDTIDINKWNKYCHSKLNELKRMFPTENIDNPKTLSEKLQWLKIYDSTPLKAFCADKITVRDYCKEKLGIDLCIPLIKVYNKPEEIEWEKLPNQFVIKCNHGSEMNIIVKDKTNGALTDYKFLCFNGEIKYMQVVNGRGTDKLHFNYYTPNFEPMTDVSWNAHPADYSKIDLKPKNFEKMKEYASKLCKEFKCVRVDFYEINDKLYLGELTFIPASGRLTYKNPQTNLIFGNMLKLD